MFPWNKYPLVRVLVPLVAGILIYSHYPYSVSAGTLLLISVGLLLSVAVTEKYRHFHHRILSGAAVAAAVAMLSFCYTSVFVASHQPPEELLRDESQTLRVTVAEPPVEKQKSMKLVVVINQFVHNDSLKPCRTKAMLYVAKNEASKAIVYGDNLLCRTRLAVPSSPKNPHEFHYQNYLARKGIHLQGYVQANSWEPTGRKGGSFLFRTANRMRNKFLAIFAAASMDVNELGVISAILLGSDDKLDPHLAQSYASAGVSHILCVSGMHVGVIYMILAFLLKFLNRNRQQRIVRSLILVTAIWLYACITGLFPSVMRAATMFTFVSIAGLIERNTNSYNSLLGSLVFLLLLNPLLLFQVGFQFSYLAVFGIVWTQKPLRSLYNPRTKAGSYVWNIITVSLAAQLFVAPLSMMYFHCFPNYFLLTNIAVISFAPVVVGGGIAVLAFSFWEFAYHWLSLGLVYVIKLMNWIVVHIEAFPHSVTANIHISAEQVILLYGLIFSIFCTFLYKSKPALFLSLCFAVGCMGMGIHKLHQTHSQQMLLFYQTKSGYILDCIHGRTSSLFGDSAAVFDAEIYRYHILNNHIHHQIRSVYRYENQQFMSFNGKTVFVLSQPIYACSNQPKLKIDYLLLSHKNVSIETIKNAFDFKLLIFDNNLPNYKIKQLKAICEKENIAFHDLKRDGALKIQRHHTHTVRTKKVLTKPTKSSKKTNSVSDYKLSIFYFQ